MEIHSGSTQLTWECTQEEEEEEEEEEDYEPKEDWLSYIWHNNCRQPMSS